LKGTIEEILLNSLDILTFVVPPILPAAITANNAYAQKRLEKKGIHCLHSKHICLCGGIDVVAFDKVGLTQFTCLQLFSKTNDK
jgi:magnesium-transporting ATPase (P-type)